MLIITIAFKAVQVLLAVAFLLFNFGFIKLHVGRLWWLLLIGFILNIAYIAGLVFIFYKPLWARKMGIKLINLLTRIRILKEKNNEKIHKQNKAYLRQLHDRFEYIKSNVHTVINIFLITLVQRLFPAGCHMDSV